MAEHESIQPIMPSMVAMLTEAANQYHDGLSRDMLDYLASRGIAPVTAATSLLGCTIDPQPGHERVEGWLSIPYIGINPDGDEELWGIRFRCVPEILHPGQSCKDLHHGKYFGLPHAPARLYNVRAIKTAGNEIHVTEGELDAVILNQAGFPAVGLPGATQWQYHYTRALAGFSKIFVWGDPDEAGAKLVSDIMASCRNAAPVRLTVGDVTETFLQGGYAALDELVESVKWE